MKKAGTAVLVLVTALFLVFTAGLFVVKNYFSDAALTYTPNKIFSAQNTAADWRLDLNTATKEELEELPGIGEVLAQRILDYRETYGKFRSVSDLLNVYGIGDKRLEELKQWIIVEETQ